MTELLEGYTPPIRLQPRELLHPGYRGDLVPADHGPTIIEQIWAAMDRVVDQLMKEKHPHRQSELLKGQAQGIAACIILFSPSLFKTVDAVREEAVRRYNWIQAKEADKAKKSKKAKQANKGKPKKAKGPKPKPMSEEEKLHQRHVVSGRKYANCLYCPEATK